VLVPPFGAVGAGAATAVGLITDNVICSVTLFRRYRLLPWDWRAAAVAAAFGLSLIPGFLIQSILPGNFARCAVTAVLAAGITPAAAFIFEEKEERRSMMGAVRRRISPFKSKMPDTHGEQATR
jgi:O-antigen/teichoic acid export membrane protein